MRIIGIIIKLIVYLAVFYGLLTLGYFAFFWPNKFPEGKNLEMAGQGNYINLSTGEIFYREAGLGKKIILLHGYGSSSASYENLMAELSSKFRVFALDFPGFGLSSKEKGSDISFAGQEKTVIEFMDQKNIEKAYLIGHSMGGAVATQLAIDYPDRFEKLILIAPAGHGSFNSSIQFAKYLPPPVDRLLTRLFLLSNSAVKKALTEAYFEDELATLEKIKQYAEPGRTKGADVSYTRKIREGIVPDLTENFSLITQPTLVIWGKEDKIVPVATLDELNKKIPQMEGYVIEYTGHVPQEENPEGTASLIIDFLSKII